MRYVILAIFGLALVATAAGAAPSRLAPAGPNPSLQRIDATESPVSDDTDFLFQLAMMEGHLIIGHELLAAHQAAAALPHFGHPVAELYDNISDYLTAKHFPAFNGQLAALEAAVTAAPDSAETEAKYQAMITTLAAARQLTPAALRRSVPAMIEVCSYTIDAASGEYGEALEQGKIASLVEYHDSRGYLEFVDQELTALSAAHDDAAAQGLIARFRAVFAKAHAIVAPLLPDPTPRASLDQYRAIAAEAASVAGR